VFVSKPEQFRLVERDLRSFEIVKNSKTLKFGNFMQKKKNLEAIFMTQCRWKWSKKVLKTWGLLNANIKTNQEVKTRILNF